MEAFYFRHDSHYDKEYGKKDWLYINNFGYYFELERDIVTVRSVPRADFHLIYVSMGELHVDGEVLSSGEGYLFLPRDGHRYTYKKMEGSRYYWIHFTGNRASEILARFGIERGVLRDDQRGKQKDALLSLLALELRKCAGEGTDFAVSLLFSFLSLFKREEMREQLYADAVGTLEDLHRDVSVADIARSYHISTAHFIRSFKSVYRMSPNEYRQNYRISQAQGLLRMTNLSVQQISYQCGFCDPFYFSRVFRKRVGMSPSEYRREK